jgi:hypothetical protein
MFASASRQAPHGQPRRVVIRGGQQPAGFLLGCAGVVLG